MKSLVCNIGKGLTLVFQGFEHCVFSLNHSNLKFGIQVCVPSHQMLLAEGLFYQKRLSSPPLLLILDRIQASRRVLAFYIF